MVRELPEAKARKRGPPMLPGSEKTWTRQLSLRLGQEEWEKIDSLLEPHESYPQLLMRALQALEHENAKKGSKR